MNQPAAAIDLARAGRSCVFWINFMAGRLAHRAGSSQCDRADGNRAAGPGRVDLLADLIADQRLGERGGEGDAARRWFAFVMPDDGQTAALAVLLDGDRRAERDDLARCGWGKLCGG